MSISRAATLLLMDASNLSLLEPSLYPSSESATSWMSTGTRMPHVSCHALVFFLVPAMEALLPSLNTIYEPRC